MNSLSQVVVATGGWIAKLFVLIMDAFGDRYQRSRFAGVLAFVEPLGLIFIFSLGRYLNAVIQPPFGRSLPIFLATGIVPYYLFFLVSSRIQWWDTIRRIPGVNEFDILVAQVASETVMKILMLAALSALFWLDGAPDAIPEDPLECLLALIGLAVFGLGVGLINAAIDSKFFIWTFLYGVTARLGMILSGIFFVLDYAPLSFRDFASYNPIAQGVTWYRSGHYHNYPILTLDINYFLQCTVAVLVLGLLLEFLTRKSRQTK